MSEKYEENGIVECHAKTTLHTALTEGERKELEAGLRSRNAFVLRRCQILLLSSQGKADREIAQVLGCDGETVRDVVKVLWRTKLMKSRTPVSRITLVRCFLRPHKSYVERALY